MKMKILIYEGTKKDGGKFNYFRYVRENDKKLIDCRMKKTVDYAKIQELCACKKAYITTKNEYFVNATTYEYPVIYIGDIESVERII